MKNPIKIFFILICITAVMTASPGPVTAQEFESFFTEEAVAEGGPALSGSFVFTGRYYADTDDPASSAAEYSPEVNLDISRKKESSEVFASLKFSKDPLFDDYTDVINEAYLRIFYGRHYLEAGLVKKVWGKADEMKVLDLLNPLDYTDFINRKRIERKIAQSMVSFNYAVGDNGLFELVYVPVFTPDVHPVEGPWVRDDVKTFSAIAANPGFVIDYPETDRIDWSQAAARLTGTLGRFDLGLMYYYGFFKEPVIELDNSFPPTSAAISYSRMHALGTEAAFVLKSFNIRLEGGVYLSEDSDGSDPYVHNHRAVYSAGFDRSLPAGLGFLLEMQGSVILNSDEITGPAAVRDADYDADRDYTSNIFLARLEGSYRNDKIRPQIAAVWNLEKRDWILRPGIELILKDDISLDFTASVFGGDEDTDFGQFDENDFLQASFTYNF